MKSLTMLKGAEGIYTCIEADYGDMAASLLQSGISEKELNQQFQDGSTLLCAAAKYGMVKVVKALIEKGADTNVRNKDGKTPFECIPRSLFKGKKAQLENLLKSGAPEKDESLEQLCGAISDKKGIDFIRGILSNDITPQQLNKQNKSGDLPLCLAAKKGKEEVVELLIERGAEVDSKNKDGETPLYVATYRENIEIIKILLTNEASINISNRMGKTPLCYAAMVGNQPMVELLLQKGANPNLVVEGGNLPLTVTSDANIAQLLIDCGAKVDTVDRHGCTPLLSAVQAGSIDVARLLITRCADINCQDADGKTPLDYAKDYGCQEIIKYLEENGAKEGGASLEEKLRSQIRSVYESCGMEGPLLDMSLMNRNDELDSLHRAVNLGDESGVKQLLESVTLEQINKQDSIGETLLHIASSRGHEEIVRMLVDKRADVGVQRLGDDKTPLFIASGGDHEGIVKILASAGAKVDAADRHGYTPLSQAVYCDQIAMARLLLENEANPNLVVKDKSSLLSHAVGKGNVDMVQLLIEKGADINCQDASGKTPLSIAVMSGSIDMVQLLHEHGASLDIKDKYGDTPLNCAMQREHKEIVKYIKSVSDPGKVPPPKKEPSPETLLTEAELRQLSTEISLGLEFAASQLLKRITPDQINQLNKEGNTFLCIAVKKGHKEIVKLLLKAGARIDVKDGYGQTPLDYAAESEEPNISSILELLQQQAAGVDFQDGGEQKLLGGDGSCGDDFEVLE